MTNYQELKRLAEAAKLELADIANVVIEDGDLSHHELFQSLASPDVVLGLIKSLEHTTMAAEEPVKFPRDGILGVRVQDDTVIIKMMGNQRARELCHKLLTDREQEPGGNPNAFNKWS